MSMPKRYPKAENLIKPPKICCAGNYTVQIRFLLKINHTRPIHHPHRQHKGGTVRVSRALVTLQKLELPIRNKLLSHRFQPTLLC